VNPGRKGQLKAYREWADLIRPHLRLFPPNPTDNRSDHVMLPIWVDDVAHHAPSYEVLSRSRDIARRGDGEWFTDQQEPYGTSRQVVRCLEGLDETHELEIGSCT
jgi:ABC-type sulfate transport system substrate-binding protein